MNNTDSLTIPISVPRDVRPETLRVEEAAKISGFSRSKLYEEMEAGRLGYLRCGRARRIPWRELDRWMQSLGQGPLAPER